MIPDIQVAKNALLEVNRPDLIQYLHVPAIDRDKPYGIMIEMLPGNTGGAGLLVKAVGIAHAAAGHNVKYVHMGEDHSCFSCEECSFVNEHDPDDSGSVYY